jgi:hypothetical protein
VDIDDPSPALDLDTPADLLVVEEALRVER